jgi:hypothetical protein
MVNSLQHTAEAVVLNSCSAGLQQHKVNLLLGSAGRRQPAAEC